MEDGSLDDRTVEALWREHYAQIVRTAFLMTSSMEDAEELAQDTFVAALAKWRRRTMEEYAEAWLHAVVRRRAISLLRKKREQPRAFPPEEAMQEPSEPLEAALLRAIAALPLAQRQTVVLRYYLDYSVEDAARALGKRPGTVRALTSQGVARLRQVFAVMEKEERDVRDR
jgi:RNA polymerase sigma factor (sigma-70 family)